MVFTDQCINVVVMLLLKHYVLLVSIFQCYLASKIFTISLIGSEINNLCTVITFVETWMGLTFDRL